MRDGGRRFSIPRVHNMKRNKKKKKKGTFRECQLDGVGSFLFVYFPVHGIRLIIFCTPNYVMTVNTTEYVSV